MTLSTLHGAKGLECDTVVIVGFDAEHLAHRRTVSASADGNAAVEEERRLGLRIRNLAAETRTSYLRLIAKFARYYGQSPELLGPEDIRTCQLHLFDDHQLAPTSVAGTVAALRLAQRYRLNATGVRRSSCSFGRNRVISACSRSAPVSRSPCRRPLRCCPLAVAR
ncbi:MAG: phage integrase N-terminal SAM-like domain-containing protein [Acidobacteria bacterium]|nr:phage integrase N-terminal SAM-like domain-containing protein [Acidobacteriota bacterium]